MHRKEHLFSIDTLLSFSVKGFLKGSSASCHGYIQSTSFCLTSFWASIYIWPMQYPTEQVPQFNFVLWGSSSSYFFSWQLHAVP